MIICEGGREKSREGCRPRLDSTLLSSGDMKGTEFNELAFFRAIQESGARSLLIGRRALVVLGLPVLTVDYDFWIAIEDLERFNAALAQFDLQPSQTEEAARTRGRYALDNDERIDVLVARSVPTIDGRTVVFDDLWLRRERVLLDQDVAIDMPTLDDLILTKRFAARPKDLEDIRMLEILRDGRSR